LTISEHFTITILPTKKFRNDFGDGIGQHCCQVFQGTEHKCRKCPVQRTFVDKKARIAEETILLQDGSVNQKIVYSPPLLSLTGNGSAVIKLLTNVNMIKEVQKELVQGR